MGKKITRETRITSTSDVTVGDLVDAVAESIKEGASRASIEKIVKETVRPCAIGEVPTITAGDDSRTGARADGNTKRFAGGKLRTECGGSGRGEPDCAHFGRPGTSKHDDAGAPAAMQPTGRFFTPATGDAIRHVYGSTASAGAPAGHMRRTARWFDAVLQNGEVWTPYTSRRFLPSQYLRLMLAADGNVDAAISRHYTLRDVWRLLDTELEKLIFMDRNWYSAFVERCRFLPINTVRKIFTEYLDGLDKNINDRDKCTFSKRNGEYWRKIQGTGRVVLWNLKEDVTDGDNGLHSETTSIEPTKWLVELNDKIADARYRLVKCTTYDDALHILRHHIPRISMGTFKDSDNRIRNWLPKSWKEVFKKQGAYYTLKSLVVNCHVRYSVEEGDWRHRTVVMAATAREGLDKMRALLDEKTPAYVVHAILKKSIETSRFDIAKFLRGFRR